MDYEFIVSNYEFIVGGRISRWEKVSYAELAYFLAISGIFGVQKEFWECSIFNI